MSSEDNIGQLKAKFEKQRLFQEDAGRQKPLPPSMMSKTLPNTKPDGSSSSLQGRIQSPKGVNKKLTKQLDSVLSQSQKPGKPLLPKSGQSPKLNPQKSGSPGVKREVNSDITGASNALASVMSGGSHGNTSFHGKSGSPGAQRNGNSDGPLLLKSSPSPKLNPPKSGSPGVKREVNSDVTGASASNALASVMSGGSHGNTSFHGNSTRSWGSPGSNPKKPLTPSPGAGLNHAIHGNKSTEVVPRDGVHGQYGKSLEAHHRAKATKSLLLDSQEVEAQNSTDRRAKDDSSISKPPPGDLHHLSHAHKKQEAASMICAALAAKKPLPPPPKPSHLSPSHLSPQRNTAKSRSSSDLSTGSSAPAATTAAPKRLPRTPQPARVGGASPGGVPKPLVSAVKPAVPGQKPGGGAMMVNKTKPAVTGKKPAIVGTKPRLPAAKPAVRVADKCTPPAPPPATYKSQPPLPKPAPPSLPPYKPHAVADLKATNTIAKPLSPSSPLSKTDLKDANSSPKPLSPSFPLSKTDLKDANSSPKPLSPSFPLSKTNLKDANNSPKPLSPSFPLSKMDLKHTNNSPKPLSPSFPPSKTDWKDANKRSPTLPKPLSSLLTHSNLRDGHVGKPTIHQEDLSPSIGDDSAEVLLGNSDAKPSSKAELDDTLTDPLPGVTDPLPGETEEELEATMVESSDWILVPDEQKQATTNNNNEQITTPEKVHRPAPKPPTKQPRYAESAASSEAPPTSPAGRPLPSPPVLRRTSEIRRKRRSGSDPVSSKASALVVAPPGPPSLPPASVEPEEEGEEEGMKQAGGTTPPPSGSPLIRILPSSFSKALPSAEGQAGGEGGPGNRGSSRGNVDSGFISEVAEDLGLLRGTSVESLSAGSATSEDRVGVASPPPPEVEPEVWDLARVEKASKKRLNIATELLNTEKTYSNRIKVVAVDFYDVVKQYNLKSKQSISDSAVQQIFLNLKQIHQLSENILQELQDRMDTWSSNEALGDVICRLAPFLKLYAHYTSGYEDAVKMLTECSKRDRKFDAVVREFERTSITTCMGLSSFMLEPVQRIPRYRLLLRDYLKYLPPDSPDRPNTESALRIISEAADHSNDRIKELENSNVILSIQRSLVDYDGTLVAPYRSFAKKGSLLKSSRKSFSPRFFFLFTDVLLHTYPPEKDVYKFRNEMPIFGMKVEDPKFALTPFSFNIYSSTRSLILVACSEEEKKSWMSALQSAITEDLKKRSSLRRDAQLQVTKASSLFGTKPPIMVPDKSATMCQMCSAEFTVIFRRHHCRACGKVVCSNCSQQKAYLPYVRKIERVCAPCYGESKNPDRLSGDECDSPTSSPIGPRKQDSITGNSVLNLKAYEEDAVIAGYVLSLEGKKWNKMWYQVKRDCVLYKFKAHEDIKAVHSMPLPGYAIGSDSTLHTITLTHHSGMKNLCDTFKLEENALFEEWLESIRKVIRMEFDPVPPSSTSSPLHSLVTSPLARDSRSFSASNEHSTLPRPLSDSYSTSRPNSFCTVSSSDSRPPSVREISPCADEGGRES